MKKILIILLLAVSLVAEADKWYIATAANGGDDTDGDGSETAPWLTLKHACDTVTGANFVGDTIVVGAGTFTEPNQIALGVGVSIYGAGATSIIVSTFAGTYANGSVAVHSSSGNPVDGSQSISYLRFDGSSLTANCAITVNYRSNVKIHHCTFVDFDDSAVNFINQDQGTWSNAPTIDYATGNELHDCTITNCSGTANYASVANVTFLGQDGLLIYNNTITQTSRASGSNGTCIKSFWYKNCDIYNNTLYKNDHESGAWNFHMELWNYTGNNDIYDNTFRGLGVLDIGGYTNSVAAGCTYGIRVFDNYFINSSQAAYTPGSGKLVIGIDLEGQGHDRVYIYNNLIQRYGTGIAFNTADNDYSYSWSDIYVYNNVLQDIGYSDHTYSQGIYWLSYIPSGVNVNAFDEIHILHNTIRAIAGATYRGIEISAHGAVTNLNIRNNIIYDFDDDGINISERATGELTIDTINVTHNCLYSNGTNSVDVDAGVALTVSDITTGIITSDPAFISASDLHLQSTSGCINTGVDVSATTGGLDFHGASLYGAAYDIGAFEYGLNRIILIDDVLTTINYKLPLIDH